MTVNNFSPPNPPTALTSSAVECSVPVRDRLEWVYSDPDGDPQDKYEIELTQGSCSFTPAADITVGPITSGDPKHVISGLVHGADYCWRVRVTDDRGEVSLWSLPSPSPFTVVVHKYPDPRNFSWSPFFPVEDQVVQFEDCAGDCDPFDNPASTGETWLWDFGDTFTSSAVDPSHMYPARGTYVVQLTLSDDLGVACPATQELRVILPFPGWREISPF